MKKLNLLLGATVLFGGLAVQATSAFAAENQDAISTGFIEFSEDDGKTPPTIIDPEDPDGGEEIKPVEPAEPSEGGETGQTGLLTIDYTPYFNFGSQTLSPLDQEYHADALDVTIGDEKDVRNQFVQVTDRRSGAPGWELTVDMDKGFVTSDNKTLDGATLTLSNLSVTGVNEELNPSLGAEEIILGAEAGAVTVMSASEGKGFGSYQTVIGDKENIVDGKNTAVTLFVPGKTVKYADKNYIGTITWKLTAGPGNEIDGPEDEIDGPEDEIED